MSRTPQKYDLYRNIESGNLWEIEFILESIAKNGQPTRYILGNKGMHWVPLTSEELHERFEFFGEAQTAPITLYL